MRVMHVIDSAGIYGAETMLLNLAEEQQRAGLHPIILSIGNPHSVDKPLEIESRNRNLSCISLKFKDGLNLGGAREIIEIAQRNNIRIIHSHGYKGNILLGLLPKSERNIAIIATLHGWTAKRTFSKIGLYGLLDRWLLPRLDAVVLVSETMHNLRALKRLAPARVHHVPNGIVINNTEAPIDAFGQELRTLHEDGCLIIGGIGRLSPEKNFSGLIKAFHSVASRNNKIRLIILGDGPEMPMLKTLCNTLKMDSASILKGYTANAKRYIDLFDLFVLPSLTEGLPMVVLEAMIKGVPIIASAVGAIPRVLNGSGLIVAPGDTSALTTALQSMIKNIDFYRTQAAAQIERINAEYSAVTMASRYEAIYRMVSSNTLESK